MPTPSPRDRPIPATPAAPRRRSGARWTFALLGLTLLLGVAVAGFAARREWIVGRDAAAARAALDAGRLDEADAIAERWGLARPKRGEPLTLRAEVAFRRGRLLEADGALTRAEANGDFSPAARRLRGLLLARSNREAEAEPRLVTAWTTRSGPDPVVAEALARLYLGAFRMVAARDVLDAWAAESPDDARPCLWRTEVDRRLDVEPATTIAHYREALRRDPTLDAARLGLADRLRTANQEPEAADEFDAYLARRPDDPAAHLGRARTARALGDEATAIAHYDRVLAINPADTLALTERAAIDLAANRGPDALARLDKAVNADPFDPEIRYARALALQRLGRGDEARSESETGRRLRAEHERFADLGETLVRNPRDNRARAEAARWMIEHGRSEEGIVWAEMVLRELPDHPDLNRLLADLYQKRGELGVANFYRARIAAGN